MNWKKTIAVNQLLETKNSISIKEQMVMSLKKGYSS